MKGFKEFLLRGNVIDLAVAVVIGAAFTAIVNALVTGIFNPLIGAVFNAESLDKALIVAIPTMSGGSAKLLFGHVLGAIINFIIVAAVVYFCLVLPINHLMKMAYRNKTEEDADTPPTQEELLEEIRDLLADQAQRHAAVTPGGSTPQNAGRPIEPTN